jgi:hypothetical protein
MIPPAAPIPTTIAAEKRGQAEIALPASAIVSADQGDDYLGCE